MMAYMDFSGQTGAAVLEPLFPPARVREGQATTFTQREWSVVWVSRNDSLDSIREEGRFARLVRLLFGIERQNPLSDERLEALRRMAVLGWHRGYDVAPSDIDDFIAAGFSERQYELLLERIVAERALARRR